MSCDRLILSSDHTPGVALRSAVESDCEALRVWKNSRSESFFHQDVITPDAQRAWFDGYRRRPDDHMFIVEVDGDAVGCMGVRLIDEQADIYNVILGRPEYGGQGVMARGMQLLCSEARRRFGREIVARVLRNNPALSWYIRRGFAIVSEGDTYVLVRLSGDDSTSVPLVRQEFTA